MTPEEIVESDGFSVLMSTSIDNGVERISYFELEEGDVTESQRVSPEAALFIPKHIVNNFNSSMARLVVTTYREDSLFQSRNLTLINQNQEDGDYTVDVNSRIISAFFGNIQLDNLENPIKLIFLPVNKVGLDISGKK